MRRKLPLTDKYLSEIEARAKAATPGPWQYHRTWQDDRHRAMYVMHGYTGRASKHDNPWIADLADDNNEDAEFIAHAREDIPALLAEIRRLQAELEIRGG